MNNINFTTTLHKSTKRNYVERVISQDKCICAGKAKEFGFDYWDGERKYGYGGYKYDGRWSKTAKNMLKHYGINNGESVLDVG